MKKRRKGEWEKGRDEELENGGAEEGKEGRQMKRREEERKKGGNGEMEK